VNSNTKHGYPVAGAAHEMHADHREHSGHNQHAGHSVAMFRDKFWLSLALALAR
jgi:Cu2+-exporting ATPase